MKGGRISWMPLSTIHFYGLRPDPDGPTRYSIAIEIQDESDVPELMSAIIQKYLNEMFELQHSFSKDLKVSITANSSKDGEYRAIVHDVGLGRAARMDLTRDHYLVCEETDDPEFAWAYMNGAHWDFHIEHPDRCVRSHCPFTYEIDQIGEDAVGSIGDWKEIPPFRIPIRYEVWGSGEDFEAYIVEDG